MDECKKELERTTIVRVVVLVIAVVLPLSLLRRKTDGDLYLYPNSL